MKNSLLFFLILLFASGCSGFYHLHYHKLNKVPASGNYASTGNSFSKNIPAAKIKPADKFIPLIDSSGDSSQAVIPAAVQKKNKIYFSLRKKNREIISPENKITKKIIKDKIQRAKDHKGLIIFAMILIGLALLTYGIVLIGIGIFGPVYWMILAGIGVLGLGLLPFLGIISMLAGDKFNPEKKFEEKKR